MNGAWHQWGIGLLVALGILGAGVSAFPAIWRFLKAAARVPFVIEGVAAEFSPNGGGSLKDSIEGINQVIAERTAVFERLDQLVSHQGLASVT